MEILVGLLIMRIGKAALDKVLPPVITGSVAIVIGIALAGAALGMASRQLAGGIHHADLHRRLLGLLAGQGAARHAAHPAGRHRRLHRFHPIGPGELRAGRQAASGCECPTSPCRPSPTRAPGRSSSASR
ncbi:MAG: hypothetical protein M0C28_44000 [Candidatus Moduliflexus flocculans]|nr:hypothetical protein [Candidatus Moduliflexus flocculans]